MPRGSERPRSPHQAVRALYQDPRLTELRADFARNVCNWLEVHARRAQWADDAARQTVRCVSFPGRARVCALTGMSVSTYQRCRRLLRAWGYVGLVREGWTPALRAGGLSAPGAANRAAVYVLAVPRTRAELTPPRHRLKHPPGPAVQDSCSIDPLTGSPSGFLGDHDNQKNPTSGRCGPLPRPCAHFPHHTDVLRAAARQKLSDKGASRLARPFAEAGWTPDQLRYAVSTRPDGHLHPHRHQRIRLPFAWMAYRLAFWLDDTGCPVDFPQAAADELGRRARERAEVARRRTAAPPGRAADPAPHAAAIRAALGWKRPG